MLAHKIGGPLNATESKCDLTLKSDSRGSIYFRILPDIVYAHPNIGGGFFPVGSGYQGAEIKPFVDALAFVTQVFTYLHPNAKALKILKLQRLAGEKQALDQGMAHMNQILNSVGLQSNQSDVAGGVFEYMEDKTMYREVILSAVLNMPAAVIWKNTRTLAFRAPAKKFDQWRATMDIIRFSVRFNLNWLIKEFQGQDQLARKAANVFKEMNRIDQGIMQKSNINRSEIMNDNFLALTGQEEFVNPKPERLKQTRMHTYTVGNHLKAICTTPIMSMRIPKYFCTSQGLSAPLYESGKMNNVVPSFWNFPCFSDWFLFCLNHPYLNCDLCPINMLFEYFA